MAEEESSVVPTISPTVAAKETSTLILGVTLGLLGSICINTGNNIQARRPLRARSVVAGSVFVRM